MRAGPAGGARVEPRHHHRRFSCANSQSDISPRSIRVRLAVTLQGFLSGIGFLGWAVIFKSGFDVKGIKAAAAIWCTGALGLQ